MLNAIEEVENFLISTYGAEMNSPADEPAENFEIEHLGDLPECLAEVE